MVAVWAEILNRSPGSRLLLNSRNFADPRICRWMARRFLAHGVAAERLSMGYDSPSWKILRDIDITLDCFPHNSATTLLEGLYCGIPAVTLAGRPSVGRFGATILTALDRREWIAATEASYIEKAVALAADRDRLATVRSTLRREMTDSPLMDEAGFAQSVEAAYHEMWRRHASGMAPAPLSIERPCRMP